MDRTIEALRESFFPGWVIQRASTSGNGDGTAYYRIECRTLAEYRLACVVKPNGIQADILYLPRKRREVNDLSRAI